MIWLAALACVLLRVAAWGVGLCAARWVVLVRMPECARSRYDALCWAMESTDDSVRPHFGQVPSPQSLYRMGSRVVLDLQILGVERALVAHWVSCGSERDVYSGYLEHMESLGAFVVKIGTSVFGKNGNLKEWVNYCEHGFISAVAPLLYAETGCRHLDCDRCELENVTVLVEAAVLVADVAVRVFSETCCGRHTRRHGFAVYMHSGKF